MELDDLWGIFFDELDGVGFRATIDDTLSVNRQVESWAVEYTVIGAMRDVLMAVEISEMYSGEVERYDGMVPNLQSLIGYSALKREFERKAEYEERLDSIVNYYSFKLRSLRSDFAFYYTRASSLFDVGTLFGASNPGLVSGLSVVVGKPELGVSDEVYDSIYDGILNQYGQDLEEVQSVSSETQPKEKGIGLVRGLALVFGLCYMAFIGGDESRDQKLELLSNTSNYDAQKIDETIRR